jgi:hypothetical protein
MEKIIVGILSAFLLVTILSIGFFSYNFRPQTRIEPESPQAISVKGIVKAWEEDTKILTLTASSSRDVAILLSEKTVIHNQKGEKVSSLSLESGQKVTIIGVLIHSSLLDAASIFIAESKNEIVHVQPDNVFEESILPLNYTISGHAESTWFQPKGYFNILVLDGMKQVIAKVHAYPLFMGTSTNVVPFSAWVSFTLPQTATGTVRFESTRLASSTETLSVAVRFAQYKNKYKVRQ